MVQNLDRRQPEGAHREIPPMTKEILEARTRKSIDELHEMYKTDEQLDELAQQIAKPGELEAYAETGRSLKAEIGDIMKTHESKQGFFNRAGNFFKKAGGWVWRNKLPILLTGLSLLGVRYAGDIKKWGGKKVDEGVDYLADKLGLAKLKEGYDAMKAKADALQKRLDDVTKPKTGPKDAPAPVGPGKDSTNLDDVGRPTPAPAPTPTPDSKPTPTPPSSEPKPEKPPF